jgi:predicted metal-dependent HD superfamily phosphohydrolase
VRRWSEPHRHYHTVEHLDECLAWLDAVGGSDELVIALYFHDAIYDPTRSDNEAASAALFTSLAIGVDQAVVARVSALILSTAKHTGDGEAALLADIDLAILGASPARYDRFERDVRREYARFDDAQRRTGRARVLRGFLERMSIYQTSSFQHLEPQARRNLARACARLEA